MDSNQQKFKWALLVVDRMKQLRAEGFRFVDQEVIPNFDGTPKGMFAWFICEHYYAREEFDLQDHFCDQEQDIGTPSKTTSTGTWRSFRKLPVSRDSSGRPDFSTIQSRRKWLLGVSRLLRMREPDRRGCGVLRFFSEVIAIFPDGSKAYSRDSKWGTLIKLIAVQIRGLTAGRAEGVATGERD